MVNVDDMTRPLNATNKQTMATELSRGREERVGKERDSVCVSPRKKLVKCLSRHKFAKKKNQHKNVAYFCVLPLNVENNLTKLSSNNLSTYFELPYYYYYIMGTQSIITINAEVDKFTRNFDNKPLILGNTQQ